MTRKDNHRSYQLEANTWFLRSMWLWVSGFRRDSGHDTCCVPVSEQTQHLLPRCIRNCQWPSCPQGCPTTNIQFVMWIYQKLFNLRQSYHENFLKLYNYTKIPENYLLVQFFCLIVQWIQDKTTDPRIKQIMRLERETNHLDLLLYNI